MRQVFNSKFKITQQFGVSEEYYKQFGLKGHEGLDIIPTGTVWDVYCLEDGVVVRDIDDTNLGKNYGKNVTVWHPNIGKATQYCHLASNDVSMGQRLTKGEKIGVMGATGNTTGPHLHLNLFEVDTNGVRLNRDNGYFGGINPLPFLEEVTEQSNQEELDKVRKARDDHWNDLVAIYDVLQTPQNQELAIAELKKLVTFEDKVVEQDKMISDATSKITGLESQIKGLQGVNEALLLENTVLREDVQKESDTIKKQSFSINSLKEEIEEIKKDLKTPILTGWQLIIEGIRKLLRGGE